MLAKYAAILSLLLFETSLFRGEHIWAKHVRQGIEFDCMNVSGMHIFMMKAKHKKGLKT